jgi:rhodanese-related sulfurtransferase
MQHAPRFLAFVNDAKTRIPETTVEKVRADLESATDFVLIDTREESEFGAGHATGAIHIGKGVIERDIEKLVPDTGKKLVLYCGGGFRSALAADALRAMGYTNVYSLAGGWRAWKEAGMPMETDQ